jgi:DNA-binding transcriptional regulator YiaG
MLEAPTNRLKEIRESAEPKIELYDIAHCLRVSTDTVRRWDDNKLAIPSKYLATLIDLLGCTSDHLLGLDRQSTETPKAAA